MDLTPEKIYDVMKSIFPEKNDYFKSDYVEELQELKEFNVNSVQHFKLLMKKHKDRILEIDAQPIDPQHYKWYNEDPNFQNLKEMIQKGYWFAFPAIIRLALELEFGDKYLKYSYNRDGI